MKTGIMGEYEDTIDPWYERYKKLQDKCTEIDIFECEGRYYYGTSVNAIKAFIDNNPQPADLSVWLQDNWEEFKS